MLSNPAQIIRRRHVAVVMALLLVAGVVSYLTLYVRWINGTTAIPTFDQAAYVEKTWFIADRIAGHPLSALNPLTYLSEPHANRPPLMMTLAALLLGRDAQPATIAYVWLIARLVILFGACGFIAARLKNGWWIPAAALTILSAPGWLKVYPNILMMDQTLEVTALLALGCIAWDFHARTPRSAIAAVLTFLAALMIKPAAAILFAPWFAGLLWQLGRRQMSGARLAVFLSTLVALILLALTPYGRAAAELYALGTKGYWNFPTPWSLKLQMISLLIPFWLLAAVVAGRLIQTRNTDAPESTTPSAHWLLIPAIIIALWWFCFNALITFSFDPRIVPAAMAVAVTAACVYVARSWRSGLILTVIAAVFFQLSLFVAAGRVAEQNWTPWLKPQPVIKDVGLREIASVMKDTDELRGKRIMIASNDDFVEVAALRVAARLTPGYADYQMESFPWGPDPNVVERLLEFDFVLAKKHRSRSMMVGDVYASLTAIEKLMHDPESPLREHFEPLWTLPTFQPDLTDEVTLYRVNRDVPAELRKQAVEFTLPQMNADTRR